MTGKPQNLELLAQHGTTTFDVDFLDAPGGDAIQPSRNSDANDLFDPGNVAQDDPADFVTPSVMIWDEGTSSLIAVPGGYNSPLIQNLRYAGTVGGFLVDLVGQNTRLTSALVNQRWAIVWDTEINGFPFRTYEFLTVRPDGDAAFGGNLHAYGDPAIIRSRASLAYTALGLASDDALTALIQSLNERASAAIDSETQRDFVSHSDTINMDGSDLQTLMLPGYPVIAVTQILEDGAVKPATDYRIKATTGGTSNAGILEHKPPGFWDSDWNRYAITYVWGYQSPPADLRSVAENLVVRGLIAITANRRAPGATSVSMDGFSVAYDKDMLRTLLSDDDRRVLGRYARTLTV